MKQRGLAAMSPERRQEIAAKGRQAWMNMSPEQRKRNAHHVSRFNGTEERKRIIEQMDVFHCGGCGQGGLCEQIEQYDSRLPRMMWLCGICQEIWGKAER